MFRVPLARLYSVLTLLVVLVGTSLVVVSPSQATSSNAQTFAPLIVSYRYLQAGVGTVTSWEQTVQAPPGFVLGELENGSYFTPTSPVAVASGVSNQFMFCGGANLTNDTGVISWNGQPNAAVYLCALSEPLPAGFAPIFHTLNFLNEDGTVAETSSQLRGFPIPEVDDPAVGDGVFAGWFLDQAFTTPMDFGSVMSDGSVYPRIIRQGSDSSADAETLAATGEPNGLLMLGAAGAILFGLGVGLRLSGTLLQRRPLG